MPSELINAEFAVHDCWLQLLVTEEEFEEREGASDNIIRAELKQKCFVLTELKFNASHCSPKLAN